jgi:UDP-2,4-diacetamido-2,4,6-trideoxy-beta-L-altropyranose hydrolase
VELAHSVGQMKPGKFLIRTDATTSMGTGHVMRCLALAQAWQDAGGQATFAMACTTPSISQRLRDEGVGSIPIDGSAGGEDDSAQTIALAENEAASWVIIDGYQFGSRYQQTLKDGGLKVLALDDNASCSSYSADFVLNQNLHAREDLYPGNSPNTRFLLGTKYALLRREFVSLRGYRREIPPIARNLLVAMGGSDPDNVTARVLDALDTIRIPGLRVVVVAGGSNPHTVSLAARISASRHECQLLANVVDMPGLISRADLAISAAGTVCWEYCLLGLPAVILAIAENQVLAAKALHSAGIALLAEGGAEGGTGKMAELITRLANSKEERAAQSVKAQGIVDGKGAERVVSILLGEAVP